MAGWSWLDVCQDIPRPSTGCQPSTRRRRKKTAQRDTNQNKDGIAISIESQLDAATMLSVHSCPRPEGRGPRTKTTTKTQNHDQDHNKCKDQDVLDWVTKWLIGLGERQWFGRWCGHNEKKSMDEENNVCASCQERFLWRSPNLQLSLSLLTLPTPGRPSANQCQDPQDPPSNSLKSKLWTFAPPCQCWCQWIVQVVPPRICRSVFFSSPVPCTVLAVLEYLLSLKPALVPTDFLQLYSLLFFSP